MSKEELFSILNDEQREYAEFLIDSAYSSGYCQGMLDNSMENM
jgi:hypothetical protein